VRNIRLLIAYDGTDFSGYQKQKDLRTVQGEIEAALEKLHKEKVGLTGSGRTDAGVHAAGQVANFYTTLKTMEACRFVPALNSILPRDIRILGASETLPDFHSRFDAKSRTYRYFILPCRRSMPWELRYSWQIRRRPRVERLNELAGFLRGEMDCSVFAVPGDKSLSRSRCISNAVFFIEEGKLVFEISANAFLWKMVRSVVGTLIHYEEKDLSPPAFGEILASGDRGLAGPTAPPNGLFLWKIEYYRE
jgi:tRNA pseudouridine38-40 synthase